MSRITLVAGALALALATPALAQSTVSPSSGTMTGSSNQAVNPSNKTGPDAATTGTVTSNVLEKGASSFTENQARSRIEGAGFTGLNGLTKSEDGIWQANASKDGRTVKVGLDYKGNVGTLN